MFISEVYQSNQGEGRLTGTPSVFVRVSGCNLRCDFCDTPFASWNPEGKTYSLAQLEEEIISFQCEHVVVTGGEPMIFKDLPELCGRLSDANLHITIETAGTQFSEVRCDLMSISPKLSNSTPSLERAGEWRERHEKTRHRPDVVQNLINRFDYQLKFVVHSQEDCAEIASYLAALDSFNPDNVMMMPEGTTVEELDRVGKWLAPFCNQHGYQFCDRMHIRWYGNRRGT